MCDLAECLLPDCFCSADGTQAPGIEGGKLEVTNLPMMITFTFNGAVNDENVRVYDRLFHGERLNPKECTAKATFFVSHKYTNYSAVQELHRKGHEIGVFSITNEDDPKYWTDGNYDSWLAEMAGSRLIIERVGGNEQFNMMADQYFAYDSSITAPLSRVPIWPYTLQYRMLSLQDLLTQEMTE